MHAQSDTLPPTLVSRSPLSSATGVSTQITVRAIFSEPIEPATLSIELRNSANGIVSATSSYDGETLTASLNPSADLDGGSAFTATISGVRDPAGNLMSDVSWSFTTATPSFQESTVFSGLTEPTAIEFASDGRVFVAEKSGLIKVFGSLSATAPTVFADLRTNVYSQWDRGLLGMALHPQFPDVPNVYVLYAHDAPIGGTAPFWGTPNTTSDPCPTPPGPTTNGCVISARLSRLHASGNVWTGLEQVLIEDWFQQFPSHSIGSLVFGADGALYASGGDGASFNFVDYGQTGNPTNPGGDPSVPVGGTQTSPTAEGGALRSQDLRTLSDPVTLDGTIVRIDPDTAAALPDNPLFFNPDPNAKRVIAYGLRNPFRITVRPGTTEIWIGDVGWSTWEEINRVADPIDGVVDNFGWPCYEGPGRQSGYSGTNLNLCEQLYNEGPGAVVAPFYAYRHDQKVSTETCSTGGSSISGLAFHEGSGNYPSRYAKALFFADYSRNCIWAMLANAAGVPSPATREPFRTAEGPVQLKFGPDGNLYYVSLGGSIRRIRYFPGNQPPTAAVQATPTVGAAPLTVTFSATGSSDPESSPLAYAWDLDGDGQFDDSTTVQPTWTYEAGVHTARVRVSDQTLFDIAAVKILADEAAPTAVINTPSGGLTWKVGDVISFSGSATDPQDGTLLPARLRWSLNIQHCPQVESCHTHPLQTFDGVASGSFSAPDHGYPSHIELTLTATDSAGLQDSVTLPLQPQTVPLTLASDPSGLQLVLNSASNMTPFTRSVIVGSMNSLSAPSPQGSVQFSGWSDGGAQAHNIVAGASAATYIGSYTATTPGPTVPAISVADISVSEGNSGTTNAVLTLTLSAASSSIVSVNFATANGTATAETDYTGTSGTATFTAGTNSTTITIPVTGDTTLEPSETFRVNLTSPVNATIADAQAIATIANDDTIPAASIAKVTVTEGNSGSIVANFVVTLSGASTQVVRVAYVTADGTATSGVDYLTASGTLTFPAGTTSQKVQVSVLGDTLDEANETFTVSLSSPENATIGMSPGTGTINDNDATPSLRITDQTVTEGDAGTQNAVFTVTLSVASGRIVTVNYSTSNATASAGAGDYSSTSGALFFAPGTTTQQISVPVSADVRDEADETFNVNLNGPTAAMVADSKGVGTILDDDPTPTVSIKDVSITEGNTGTKTVTFTLTLSAASGRSITVSYATADGTAIAGSDYTAKSGAVTFNAGVVTRTVTVTIIGETVIETNETFVVTLTNAINVAIADGEGVCTIVNND